MSHYQRQGKVRGELYLYFITWAIFVCVNILYDGVNIIKVKYNRVMDCPASTELVLTNTFPQFKKISIGF